MMRSSLLLLPLFIFSFLAGSFMERFFVHFGMHSRPLTFCQFLVQKTGALCHSHTSASYHKRALCYCHTRALCYSHTRVQSLPFSFSQVQSHLPLSLGRKNDLIRIYLTGPSILQHRLLQQHSASTSTDGRHIHTSQMKEVRQTPYSNFGHKQQPVKKLSVIYLGALLSLFIFFFGFEGYVVINTWFFILSTKIPK